MGFVLFAYHSARELAIADYGGGGLFKLDSFPDRQLDANDRYGAREDAEASIRPKQVSDVRHLYYNEHEHSQLRSYSQASSCQ